VDETIQRFVPDRGPSIFDVGIDTCGVLTGMLLIFIGHSILTKQTNHPMEETKL
jgi:VanZ family protein